MPELIRQIGSSRAAERMLAARPALAGELADPAPFPRAEMARALEAAAGEDEAAFRARLRRLRQRVWLRVLARDLGGRAGLAEVCGTMSDLAEVAAAACVRFAGCEELMVVAMGKLGGRELNVSSDIDLVFVHPGGDAEQERCERAARRVTRLLDDVTEDGFVFRVDLRLRPYGDAGPLACSLDFLETYFVAQGREWERYAWIKARPLTGLAAQAALDAIVRPFVYRKYLDYATLAAMRRLHGEVRREVARRELAEHVKLGPGGIREIEFIAQAQQMIRGGRDPELTARPTLEVLALLGEKNLLEKTAIQELSAAYVFLRDVEHRLQYLDDAQIHDLPESAEDRARVARMARLESWEAFKARLDAHRASVSRHFEQAFAEREHIAEPWPAHPRLDALRASRRYALLPADSKQRVEALVPRLARAAGATGDPEATIARGVDLIEAVASRAAYLALLAERPEALERVTRLIAASSWAAHYVTVHPLLLDELLDDRVLYAAPDWPAFQASLGRQLAAAGGDAEREMNVVREAHQAQVFRLLAQDLAGLLTVERLADHLSALADMVLQAALETVWRRLPSRHADGPPCFAIVAYGKLGGKELGYASDLDLIFLYDDPREGAPETYARLGMRLNNWLTARTSAGALFETDLRLRPSGEAGLLVSSIAAFRQYQESNAQVWEHQALTRARYCAGSNEVGNAFETVRNDILKRKRDLSGLRKEILQMREKMHLAHPNRSGLFDLKHDRGGMIDIEFAVQCLVLANAHRFEQLTGNLGNIALLRIAGELSLIEKTPAEKAGDAYREYRRRQHALRLNGAHYARVPKTDVLLHEKAVTELWRAVFSQ